MPFDLNRSIPITYEDFDADLPDLPAALDTAFDAMQAHDTMPFLLGYPLPAPEIPDFPSTTIGPATIPAFSNGARPRTTGVG